MKGYRMMIDNHMRGFGDIDMGKKVIRVNAKRSKKEGGKGEVLDSMVHEIAHANHPQMHEKTIRKHTDKVIKHMGDTKKRKVYNMFEH